VGSGTLFASQSVARREGKERLDGQPTPAPRPETSQAERLALSRQSILFLLACIGNPRCTKACQSPSLLQDHARFSFTVSGFPACPSTPPPGGTGFPAPSTPPPGGTGFPACGSWGRDAPPTVPRQAQAGKPVPPSICVHPRLHPTWSLCRAPTRAHPRPSAVSCGRIAARSEEIFFPGAVTKRPLARITW